MFSIELFLIIYKYLLAKHIFYTPKPIYLAYYWLFKIKLKLLLSI